MKRKLSRILGAIADLNYSMQWVGTLEMKFNMGKCRVVVIYRNSTVMCACTAVSFVEE